MIPYTRHDVDDADVQAVVDVLRSDRLTQGSTVPAFERAVADTAGAAHAVACSSGTAALYLMIEALDRDRVAIPALTFVATAAAAHHAGPEIVIEDVDDETLTMRASKHLALVVDYAGYAAPHGGTVVFDAAHSFGARRLNGVGLAAAFSFHPAKTITTGEGGAVVTDDPELAQIMRRIRDHGRRDGLAIRPGWNFRMSDIHAALGLSQILKTARFLDRRRQIAQVYMGELADLSGLRLPHVMTPHAWHLFVVRVPAACRDRFRVALADHGVGTQVHYPLVYEHPAFRSLRPAGGCPVAEKAAREVVSLPIFPAMTNDEIGHVVDAVRASCKAIL